MCASMTCLFASFLFSALFLIVGISNGSPTPNAYWSKVFPYTPMPNVMRALLPSKELSVAELARDYMFSERQSPSPYRSLWMVHDDGLDPFLAQDHSNNLTSPFAPLFFLEKDLQPGSKVNLTILSPTKYSGGGGRITRPTFLRYEEAQAIPFSTSNLTDILRLFSIESDSFKASLLKKTLHDCEMPAVTGEAKYCATSLESMIDFAISQLGTRDIQALDASAISKKDNMQVLVYKVCAGGVKMNSLKVVTCHNMLYPYAVFYCHSLARTRSYTVPLVADDGSHENAIAVCHFDTSGWNPMHVSFRLLGVKPGTVLCHFLFDSVVWVLE